MLHLFHIRLHAIVFEKKTSNKICDQDSSPSQKPIIFLCSTRLEISEMITCFS